MITKISEMDLVTDVLCGCVGNNQLEPSGRSRSPQEEIVLEKNHEGKVETKDEKKDGSSDESSTSDSSSDSSTDDEMIPEWPNRMYEPIEQRGYWDETLTGIVKPSKYWIDGRMEWTQGECRRAFDSKSSNIFKTYRSFFRKRLQRWFARILCRNHSSR